MKIFRSRNSKKTLLASLTLAGLVGLCRASAQAQTVTLICGGNMDFGTIVPGGGGGGTVTLHPGSGTRTTSGAVSVIGGALIIPNCSAIGSFSAVQFSVATATVNIVSGANTMAVNAFNVNTDAQGPIYYHNGTTATDIKFGATLNVSGTQAAGTYSGTFTVTATGF